MNAPLRVLVVEDEMLLRWSIAETLVHGGHTVVEADSASSAVEALERLPEQPIDVVLMDYRLPDSHDLSLLAAVRKLRPASAVVMMTAFGTPDMRAGALRLGVHRVVDKPFDMQAIEPLLREACASRLH
jgi:DNA-binding NtrC family response regulator